MTEPAPTDPRDALLALLDAAPGPVPAEHVLPLLRRLQGEDVESLARLAYRALTGVEPAPGERLQRPTELVSGFPLFVSEVLSRAIEGPDERRPTPQALLVVLDTVAASPGSAPAPDHVAEASVEGAVEASVEEEEPRRSRGERATLNHDFHAMIAPGHAIPRFEPLEGAGELPGFTQDDSRKRVRRRSSSGPSRRERRQTLIWVAAIAVLMLLVLYLSR